MSKNMFRMALEGETIEMSRRPEEPTIVMSGPLSEIFTKALDITYAKTDPITDRPQIAQESQAQDVTVMQKIIESINNNSTQTLQSSQAGEFSEPGADGEGLPTSGADIQIYGVSKADITSDDVVDVADALMNEDTETKPKDFVVIVDSTLPGANGEGSSAPHESVEYLSEAMEALVHRLGGRFYRSFEEFVEGTVNPETDLGNGGNDGADGTGSRGDTEAQQGGEGQKGDPATDPCPKDPSITSAVVNIAKIAQEEAVANAAVTPDAAANGNGSGESPDGDATGISPALENGRGTGKKSEPGHVAQEDGNTDTGQPVVAPVQALANDPGTQSPEAKAAIGAGDKKIPSPSKDGEVPAGSSSAGDPTVPVATGDAMATESFRVRVITLAPRTRVRIRK